MYACDVVLYEYTNLLCIYWTGYETDSDSVPCDVCGMMLETEYVLRIHRWRIHEGMHIFLIANILSGFSRKGM